MTASWALLAHLVDAQTWLLLVGSPAAQQPAIAAVALTVGVVLAALATMLIVRAAARLIAVVAATRVAWPASPPAEAPRALPRQQTSVLLAAGHGSRAPGRPHRRPVLAVHAG
jgi:hypothetical protein